ncbi:tRNA (5-methylaminomethyl-2-thiouridine)(34)-methyltransferase MnmD [Ramlibacter albus]|uniref:tRNA 5-methylaminomethyl-2-thiouridine biosynthesis bifunctional protein MnmC n=1 Tax=Ramlibacter albus TaxID=2079448 RepID=A0A923S5A5_9BURK|nr:tRNA (5-methylaminomethyl-2-thiouridine)(34)-methyltransferase MnmD [Ramlibacter albus]MBC5767768.1 tRNA (5-methylaminomethyl-2-thiouridine)(34)-methyltransferase MnmD [Ramlibacter albus]
MAEPVEWGPDGTPRSARFDDIYRTASGGLQQARHVFLQGCGLPQAWAGKPQWRILETGFGLGLNFLAAWQAWRDDPQRPRMLHFVSIEAYPVGREDILRSAEAHPELQPLARELARQWWGLVPGFHRMSFEGGQVLLTLCVGDVHDMLREQAFRADAVLLDGFEPKRNGAMWELPTLKAIARLCRRGTAVATWTVAGEVRRDLAQCGFVVEKVEGLPPKRECLRGVYDPAWETKGPVDEASVTRSHCVVIGAGLAGAAVAAALARRGWEVEVLDAAARPASGASSLPAGLLAPHQSPDDNLLSRLSRAGVRATLQELAALLPQGDAWQRSGVLEMRLGDERAPPALGDELLPWTRVVAGGNWWHEAAGWARPSALVQAWLQTPGITRRMGARVRSLERDGDAWRVLGDAQVPQAQLAGTRHSGTPLARSPLVIVTAAFDSGPLLGGRITLHPVRGQVSWSHEGEPGISQPVNGNGHFVPRVPVEGRMAWLTGSTYGRGDTDRGERAEDHRANLERLRTLLPDTARALSPVFERGAVHAWAGVRCASSDRRPLVGLVEDGLAVSTAMGSRGLTFAWLCAELLAARLHGEPLPVERKLAGALDVARQFRQG